MNENQTPALKVRPTKKQRELLDYIDNFITEHGYSPSYREIMVGLNYTSVATVALHVGNLINRGHLRKRDHSARSLEVVLPAADDPAVQSTKVTTNQVKPAEEKWLVERINYEFNKIDESAEADLTAEQVDDLAILLAAMKILGLEAAAQSFAERLAALRKKIGMPKNL